MNKKIKTLEEIYKKIPPIECKGMCHHSCTVIPAAKIEIKRARERLKKNPFNSPAQASTYMEENKNVPSCKALIDKRCSIYTMRPAICRLFGVVENLKCPYGCIPERYLTKKESYDIIQEIADI
jgi:uncharacterized protein